MMKRPQRLHTIGLLLLLIINAQAAGAQCGNWIVSANVTTASTCAANGIFSAIISGPDAANLSNIQYGIPVAANGFSVPLNPSASFGGIPPGAYTVSAVATCGGVFVGRNTSVVVPGNYVPPALTAGSNPSLSCAVTGRIGVNVSRGVPPYIYIITAHPAAYTGRLRDTSVSSSYQFAQLPPGTYTVQVIDACFSGTAPVSVIVGSQNPSAITPMLYAPASQGCDTLVIPAPYFPGFASTDTFRLSVQVSGGISAATPFRPLPASTAIRLPAGKTIKDCYGQTVTYTFRPPCGPDFTRTQLITAPTATASITPACNLSFTVSLGLVGPVCRPVTYTLHNNTTNTNYGPYTAATGSVSVPSLPYGSYSYSVSFTTGDGYSGTGNFSTTPTPGNPYSVRAQSGAQGLHNYIDGFIFSVSGAGSYTRTVDLFSGPAGYSYSGQWSGNNLFSVQNNGSPTASTLKFPPGSYVWKISDPCGTYYLPVTTGAQDLYQFTVSSPTQVQTCAGLQITPRGTATSAGAVQPLSFSLLLNGSPLSSPTPPYWPAYPAGTTILLTQPGVYTIVPTSAGLAMFLGGYYSNGNFSIAYPNIYTPSYTFTYNLNPPTVDINRTQGFLCKGGAPGSGQIFVAGAGGIPFASAPAPHYNYALAAAGFGGSGPYIATNTSGIFTAFGGNANNLYDLKVTDSCGAFATQQIKILDLSTTRLIAASQYVACQFDSVQLSALYLPNATYAWTGPAGFTSTLRQPVINPVGPANIGVYHVTISTAQCSGLLTDSTILTMNPAPPKPAVSFACTPRPITITVTNPSAGFAYLWDIGYLYTSSAGVRYSHYGLDPSDTLHIKHVGAAGSYNAVALDTITGCTTYSDTLIFFGAPHAIIYATHQQICAGDTTTLVARGQGAAPQPLLQWFRNGVAIPGATGLTYATTVAGSYRVRIETGPCDVDTSQALAITVVTAPVATLSASAKAICDGDTVTLQAAAGAGYSYTWFLNGATIYGAATASYKTATAGTYAVTIANGGCVATAVPLTLTASSSSVIKPALSRDTTICNAAGAFSASVPAALESIRWSTGDTTAAIRITAPGVYWVEGRNLCGTLHDTIAVHFCAPVIRALSLSKDSICEGDCVQIGAATDNYPRKYHWWMSGGHPAESLAVTPGAVCYTTAGVYAVTLAVQSVGGSDTLTGYIVVSAKPVPRFKDTVTTVAYKSIISLPACAAAQKVDWYLGDSLVCAGCPELRVDARYYYNVYRCVVRNGDCPDSCSYALRVIDIPHDLWLPDAFTPNGDGRNDLFHVITDNPNIQVVNLDVYNRWGQRVYTSNLSNGGWDGSLHGTPAEGGTYFWQLRYRVRGSLDAVYERRGDVLLLR